MKTFDELCKMLEETDPAAYGDILKEKADVLIPALREITGTEMNAMNIFASFVMGGILADGRLTEGEYDLCVPMLRKFLGDDVDYESCAEAARMLKPAAGAMKESVKKITDLLGMLDEQLREDAVIVCMMICAVDGKISAAEKKWLKTIVE